jgi:hypothetical protein
MDAPPDAPTSLLSEQIISGLCSPICFMLAAHRSPLAAKAAWGHMAEDLDDATWESLSESDYPRARSAPTTAGVTDVALAMLLKMTRLHDLGLAQLCVPDLVSDENVSSLCARKQDDSERPVREAGVRTAAVHVD